jgi:hypothetical protein
MTLNVTIITLIHQSDLSFEWFPFLFIHIVTKIMVSFQSRK